MPQAVLNLLTNWCSDRPLLASSQVAQSTLHACFDQSSGHKRKCTALLIKLIKDNYCLHTSVMFIFNHYTVSKATWMSLFLNSFGYYTFMCHFKVFSLSKFWNKIKGFHNFSLEIKILQTKKNIKFCSEFEVIMDSIIVCQILAEYCWNLQQYNV